MLVAGPLLTDAVDRDSDGRPFVAFSPPRVGSDGVATALFHFLNRSDARSHTDAKAPSALTALHFLTANPALLFFKMSTVISMVSSSPSTSPANAASSRAGSQAFSNFTAKSVTNSVNLFEDWWDWAIA